MLGTFSVVIPTGFASGSGDASVDWSALPCLTMERLVQFRREIPALGLSNAAPQCGGKREIDFFSNLLQYISQIRVDANLLPAKTRTLHPAFARENPAVVLLERFAKLTSIQFSEYKADRTNAYAVYDPSISTLYITPAFFKKTPIEAMLTLFHESQHIEPGTPGHVVCNQGRDFGTYCDQEISLSETMGSNSFEVWFALGLAAAATDLPDQAKELLRASALDRLTHSFNVIDSQYAFAQDLLVIADANGKLWQYSPWLNKLIPFPMSRDAGQVKLLEPGIFRRTDFSIVNTSGENFALLGGKNHRLEPIQYSTSNSQWQSIDLILHDRKYLRTFLNDRNELYVAKEKKGNSQILEQFSIPGSVRIKKQFMRGNNASLYLGEDGVLYGINGSQLHVSPLLQDPDHEGWQDAGSGYHRNTIFALNRQGKLFFYDKNRQWNLMNQSLSPTQGTSIRFKEGRTTLAQLNSKSQLFWTHFANQSTYKISPRFSISDFAILPRVKPHASFGRAAPVTKTFTDHCGIGPWVQDPWTWLGIGINQQGQLIFESRSSDARDTIPGCIVAGSGNYRTLSIDRKSGRPRLKLVKMNGEIEWIQ